VGLDVSAASSAVGRENWVHPALAFCRVMSGNAVAGGAESVPGRILQASLYLFSFLYPFMMLVCCELIADRSGKPVSWDTYVWMGIYVTMAVVPFTVKSCYSQDAGRVLDGLDRESKLRDQALMRKYVPRVGDTRIVHQGEEGTIYFWVTRLVAIGLTAGPQLMFTLYYYTFFLAPAMEAVAGRETTQRDTFLDSQFLLRGEGLSEDLIWGLSGPGVMIIMGALHLVRTQLVWFAHMEVLFIAAAWVETCCEAVVTFKRALREAAGLPEIVGIGALQRARSLAGLADTTLKRELISPTTIRCRDDFADGSGLRSREGEQDVDGGQFAAESDVTSDLETSLNAFSNLRVGVNTLNALLAIPMGLTLIIFLCYFLIVAAISVTGRAGDAQWIVVFISVVIAIATVALLFYMGRVGDDWKDTTMDIGSVETTFAIVDTFGETKAKYIQESVHRTEVGFEILHVVISSQSIMYLVVYLTIVAVSSGLFTSGALDEFS